MKKSSILIVANDHISQEAIVSSLNLNGYTTEIASNELEAFNILAVEQIGLVIADVNLKEGSSDEVLLKKIKMQYSKIPILIMVTYEKIENVVVAMRLGASDHLVKPFMPESLINLVQRYFLGVLTPAEQPIAGSNSMQTVLHMVARIATLPVTVLLTGGSGSGKKFIANYIHKHSKYSQGPLITIHSATITDKMLEELILEGATGSLLLDEISVMPLIAQARLSQILQSKKIVQPENKEKQNLKVRIIATTRKDLREEVANKNFREDLYFRLNVFPIGIPSLKDRKEDILPLADKIIAFYARQTDNNIPKLTQDAAEYLLQKKWLGNVRELENIIYRAMILKVNNTITVKELSIGDFDEIAMINNNIRGKNSRNFTDFLTQQEYKVKLQDN